METSDRPSLNGFLIRVRPDEFGVSGWPDPGLVDGSARVWFHGYLAEPARLRGLLGLSADADAGAIVATAWRRWGADTIERVIGEFAAVVVDRAWVAVLGDRTGLRPLYLHAEGETLTVSTDLAVLVRETGAWRALDEQYLADLMGAGQHLGARSPYRDISRLTPGEYAVWRRGRLVVRQAWQPGLPEPGGDRADHEERLRETVTRVVAGAAPPGPVAVELSGGLDSSTLCATVPRAHPVHAVSFVYPGASSSDESDWIRAALDANPVPWIAVDAIDNGHFTVGPQFPTFIAAPTQGCFTWAMDLAESAAAEAAGATALLTGEGGDAVFLAGLLPWYLGDLLRTGRLRQLLAETRRWSADADPPRVQALWARRAAVGAWRRWRRGERFELNPSRPLEQSAPWLRRDYLRAYSLERRVEKAGRLRAGSVHSQGVLNGILQAAEDVRAHYPLSAAGIEFRHPFLAPPMVDLALATPWQVGVDPRIDRAVQRYAFEGVVAETTLRRRSKQGPDEAIFRGLERNSDWPEFLVDGPAIVERGYVDGRAWARAVDLAIVGRVNSIRHFKTAVAVEVWLRQLGAAGSPQLIR